MRGRHSFNRCSRATAVLLSLIMTVTLSAQAVQAVAAPVKNRPVPEMSQIREMLEGRDYVEGDAIVVAEKSFDPAGFIRGDSEKLTEANEKSLSLTADAARETDSAVQEVAAERADISNARSYNISKVHSDSLDTAELIAKLYTSPKVISAEPNYIFNAAEAYALEGDEQTDNPGDDAGKEKADDQAGKVPDANLNVKSGLSSTGQHDPDVGDLTDPVDHGTHCSGIMVANWDGKGVAGVSASDKMT